MDDIGARICSLVHRATGAELLFGGGWVRHAAEEDEELEWHRRFATGWNVLIPHAGGARAVDGIEHPYHGEAARRLWNLTVGAAGIRAVVRLRSVPLTLRREVREQGGQLEIEQHIRNRSESPVRFGWVEHPVFDGALLNGAAGVRFGEYVVALARPPATRFDRVAVQDGRCEVRIPRLGKSLRLTWDARLLPHAYVWQERRGTTGFPWFGGVDGIGIEPASHPSGPAPIGLGPLVLQPGASIASTLRLALNDV
jgi:hypothetical protein